MRRTSTWWSRARAWPASPFEITLTLELKGVQLKIRQGRLHGLTAGAAQGEGVFSFAGRPLLQKTTPPPTLPGRIGLAPAVEPAPA